MMSLIRAAERFEAHCEVERGLGKSSLRAYKIDLSQFLLFSKEKRIRSVKRVGRDFLREWLKGLQSEYEPRTVRRKVTVIKSFFSFLEFEDDIDVNPFHKMRIKLTPPKQLPRCLSKREIKCFVRYARSLYQGLFTSTDEYSVFRNAAMIELLFVTGVRVSELVALNVCDINLESLEVRIWGKGNKERIVPLIGNDVVVMLRNVIALSSDSTEALFLNKIGNRISDQSVRSVLRKMAIEACVGIHVTPHMIRHTVATMLVSENVDIRSIQELLGHESIVTTQIYTHVSKEAQKKVLKKKHPVLLM